MSCHFYSQRVRKQDIVLLAAVRFFQIGLDCFYGNLAIKTLDQFLLRNLLVLIINNVET